MPKIGLKLFPDDIRCLPRLQQFITEKQADYIEFYARPDSYAATKYSLLDVKNIRVIHAPHSADGMELSFPGREKHNLACIDEARRYADLVGAEFIVVHIGVTPSQEEPLRQLRQVQDSRIILENRPQNLKYDQPGTSAAAVKMLMEELGCGFCLDFAHAIHVRGADTSSLDFLAPYLALNPSMYHFYDGILEEPKDQHLNLGTGNYPLKELAALIPAGKMATLEVAKDYPRDDLGLANDLAAFRNLTKK